MYWKHPTPALFEDKKQSRSWKHVSVYICVEGCGRDLGTRPDALTKTLGMWEPIRVVKDACLGRWRQLPQSHGPGPVPGPRTWPACKGTGNRLERPKHGSYMGPHITRVFLMHLERSSWDVGAVSRVPTRGPIVVPRSQPDFSHINSTQLNNNQCNTLF